MAPALLHVTMDPKGSLPQHDFHDWYNNEHGPLRMRLPFVTSGLRYARHTTSFSSQSPPWLALYNITDDSHLTSSKYLRLRAPPVKSQKEVEVMKQIDVDRRVLAVIENEDISKDGGQEHLPLVELLVSFHGQLSPETARADLDRISKAARARGIWQSVNGYMSADTLMVHCTVLPGELETKQVQIASESLLSSLNSDTLLKTAQLRAWKPYYRFGGCPRHLNAERSQNHVHQGTRLEASKAEVSAVESYATLSNGVALPFRLEGSSDPDGPVICLVNSVMVHWDIWDDFVACLLASEDMRRYRILRFAPRGRFAPPPSSSLASGPGATVDILVNDIVGLLDALLITQVECIVGVSLGGATALRASLLYPARFPKFVACDTNAASPTGNAMLWDQRIAIAEKEGAAVVTNEGMTAIIGKQLADVTVKRWMAPQSSQNAEMQKRFDRIQAGVEVNSLEGFKHQVQALFQYDFWQDMKTATSKGIFVVGAEDGKLPNGMKDMAERYGDGTTLHVIADAGHLPMVEKPHEVANIVRDFVAS